MKKSKLVSVESAHPFIIRGVYVTEFLKNGKKRRLDLTNYDKFEDEKVVKEETEQPVIKPIKPEPKTEEPSKEKSVGVAPVKKESEQPQQYTAKKFGNNKK